MTVFVDTSGLLAVLDLTDSNHAAARKSFCEHLDGGHTLLTTNYVEVETLALAQRRLGLDAVRAIQRDLRPALSIHWVSQEEHDHALSAVVATNRRSLSLVDCVSFLVMQKLSIDLYLGFDRHFQEQGFRRC